MGPENGCEPNQTLSNEQDVRRLELQVQGERAIGHESGSGNRSIDGNLSSLGLDSSQEASLATEGSSTSAGQGTPRGSREADPGLPGQVVVQPCIEAYRNAFTDASIEALYTQCRMRGIPATGGRQDIINRLCLAFSNRHKV